VPSSSATTSTFIPPIWPSVRWRASAGARVPQHATAPGEIPRGTGGHVQAFGLDIVLTDARARSSHPAPREQAWEHTPRRDLPPGRIRRLALRRTCSLGAPPDRCGRAGALAAFIWYHGIAETSRSQPPGDPRARGALRSCDRVSREDRVASWLPLYHDMGLIAAYYLPLTFGIPTIQLDPFEWVTAPVLLLEAISRERASLCWLPNFALNSWQIASATRTWQACASIASAW